MSTGIESNATLDLDALDVLDDLFRDDGLATATSATILRRPFAAPDPLVLAPPEPAPAAGPLDLDPAKPLSLPDLRPTRVAARDLDETQAARAALAAAIRTKPRTKSPITARPRTGAKARPRAEPRDLEPVEAPIEAPIEAPAEKPVEFVVEDLVEGRVLEDEGRSLPDSTLYARVFRRTLRTILPLLAADLFALAAAAVAAQVLVRVVLSLPPSAHVSLAPAGWPLGWAAWLMPAALFPLVAAYWLSGLYSEIWVHPVVELRQLTLLNTIGLPAAAAGGALAVLASAGGAAPDWTSWTFPLWCLAAWAGAVALVPVARAAARRACAGRGWWGYPALVIGSADGVAAVADVLLRAPRYGLRPVMLTDPAGRCRAGVLPVVNDAAALESIVRSESIRHAVVALPDLSAARLSATLDRYTALVPHLLVLADGSTLPAVWSASRNCGRLSGIEVRNALMLATLRAVKRAIDLTVAVATAVAGLPLALAIAAGIKLSGRGPVLYAHTRIGRRGRRFKAWKFRTMHPDGDAVLRDHLARCPAARAEWERDHKLRHDPRVTPFGRFLRRTSLDELPQVWNVLKGDMSLVGPRPIIDAEVCRYGPAFRLYASVKPGITGLWQVSGRTDVDYRDRVLLDQFYIRHWSPWLDVYILAKTVVALLSRDGAY